MAKYQIQGVHNSKLPSHPQLPKVSVGPGVTSPAIVAYESTAATTEGWAVKEDAKLYKVTAAEISALGKSGK